MELEQLHYPSVGQGRWEVRSTAAETRLWTYNVVCTSYSASLARPYSQPNDELEEECTLMFQHSLKQKPCRAAS
eukprot:6212091-Pleurochrysis_carterae.AAC.3